MADQVFDVDKALKGKMSEDQIVDYLSTLHGYDSAKAMKTGGMSRRQVIDYLASLPRPTEGPKFGPPELRPYPAYPQGHLSGKEVGGIAVSAIPTIAGGIGGAIGGAFGGLPGGVGGAMAGGAAGEAIRGAIVSKVGPENLSGPTVKTEPPGNFTDVSTGMLTEGAKQGAFELGGRAVSKALGGPLHEAAQLPENAAVRAANEKWGFGLTGPELTGSGKTVQHIGEYSIFSQGYVRNKWGESVAKGLAAVDDELLRLNPPSSPLEAGQQAQKLMEAGSDLFKKTAGRFYEALDRESKGVMVDMRPVKAWAQKILGQIEKTGKFYNVKEPTTVKLYDPKGNTLISFKDYGASGEVGKEFNPLGSKPLEDLRMAASQPDSVPFKAAHDFRSSLIDVSPEASQLMTGKGGGSIKSLTNEVTEAMERSATFQNPKARQIWGVARDFYKDGAQLFDSKTINGMMKKDPEALVEAIGKGDVSAAQRVRNAILKYPMKYGTPAERQDAQSSWGQFQEQFLRTHVLGDPERSAKMPGPGSKEFTPERLGRMKANIEGMGKGVMKEVFGGDPEGREVLQNLTDIGDSFSRINKLPSEARLVVYRALAMGPKLVGLGSQLGSSGGVLAGAKTFAAEESVPWLISRLMHSKTGTKFLIDGIGGIAEQVSRGMPTRAGKIAINVSNVANSPMMRKFSGPVLSDLARAWTIASDVQNKLDESKQVMSDNPDLPPAAKPKADPGPPALASGTPPVNPAPRNGSAGPPALPNAPTQSNVGQLHPAEVAEVSQYLIDHTTKPQRTGQRPWQKIRVEALDSGMKPLSTISVSPDSFTPEWIGKLAQSKAGIKGIRVSNPDMPGVGSITRVFQGK